MEKKQAEPVSSKPLHSLAGPLATESPNSQEPEVRKSSTSVVQNPNAQSEQKKEPLREYIPKAPYSRRRTKRQA